MTVAFIVILLEWRYKYLMDDLIAPASVVPQFVCYFYVTFPYILYFSFILSLGHLVIFFNIMYCWDILLVNFASQLV